jgi:DNA repair protein RadA/Sms
MKDFDGVLRMTSEPTKRLERWPTGIAQANFGERGIVPKSVSLLVGEPGDGRSTLSLQIAAAIAKHTNRPALIVSYDEVFEQVKHRATRIVQDDLTDFLVMGSEELQDGHGITTEMLQRWNPSLVVVDSIRVDGVRDHDLMRAIGELARADAIRAQRPWIVIGTVLSGAGEDGWTGAVDHGLFDTWLTMSRASEIETLEGKVLRSPNREAFRVLMTRRNRFGRADVESYFTMTETGLVPYELPAKD